MAVTVPVVIIGGGTAASAMGIGLGQHGLNSLIVERGDDSGDKIGESLPPSARPLLEALGIVELADNDGHLRCFGNRSAWGSDKLNDHDFMLSPYGYGWHLDRRRFERELADRAVAVGAERMTETKVTSLERAGSRWHLTLAGSAGDEEVESAFVVDATGRAAWFGRRQRAERIRDDRMVALVGFLHAADPDTDSFTLIEAVRHGWWYSATIPGGRLATAFVTDVKLLDTVFARTPKGLEALLTDTVHTHERIRVGGYRLTSSPTIAEAGGGRLDTPIGDGWLAVGDAAASFDPLSSHGIVSSMAGGLRAATAAADYLSGDAGSLRRYAEGVAASFERYRAGRRSYYAMERRWTDAPFWRGRTTEGKR